ncbi:TRAP transporter large permease [Alkalihalobacillus sp. MEB130]|uniref:TRAP transporter large permease n=1 Tax=Alkalihalobacillus sp. MEB130 TaxID=2976704 RepID=UPI0028E09DA1|nr:TRAP transporter large permease [Alkalihalobacillus sp. MEB130]MDT8862095.1 TRAP transporter large permease [Alkalihalobacillus sp. MEB130]
MTALVLFGSFAFFLLLTVPIGISLGLATLLTIIFADVVSIQYLAQSLVQSTDSFPLMAVPFFILAGEIMGKGGISERLFKLANVFVGNLTGGFAIAAVLTCMFFAAISGSGPATVAAVGGIMIPAMVGYGYDKKFATAVVVAAGSLGIIIPPSIPMVIYGVAGSVSIGDMFIAGILPGILVGVVMMVWCYIYSKKKNYKGNGEKFTLKRVVIAVNEAKWAILIPVIILGGIYGGIFTPTEAAVVAVVYATVVSVFVYKELSIKKFPKVIQDAALTSATILIIIGTANAFGRILTLEQIPKMVADLLLSISSNPIIIMLFLIILLLFVGMVMDTVAAIIILVPILLPIAISIGVDPIHFGIIMIINLAIGFITPPVGVNLFVGSGISGLSIETLARATMPFFIAMILSLAVVTLIPELSLFLTDFFR